MPQILIRDMRQFSDGLMKAKMFIDQAIVWMCEENIIMRALSDANMQIRQRDTEVRLCIELLLENRRPEDSWWKDFSAKIGSFTKVKPSVETESGYRYTWAMHAIHGEQFSVEVTFRGATDGELTGDSRIDDEPQTIQDHPDGVGGGASAES